MVGLVGGEAFEVGGEDEASIGGRGFVDVQRVG